MTELNAYQRKALAILDRQPWENRAQLYVGEKTISSLLELGYIEPLPPVPTGTERFKITQTGRAAVRTPRASKEQPKRRLSTLKPRLATMPARLK